MNQPFDNANSMVPHWPLSATMIPLHGMMKQILPRLRQLVASVSGRLSLEATITTFLRQVAGWYGIKRMEQMVLLIANWLGQI
jgi:hypothetical protein